MKQNSRYNTYSPQRAKCFRTAVANFLKEEFPRLGGPKVIDLFLDELTKIVDWFHPKAENLRPGELPWVGVAKEDRPARGKNMSQTKTRMGILPFIIENDIIALENGVSFRELTRNRIARVLKHANSCCDITLSEAELSLIFSISRGTISNYIRQYEKEHNVVLPRRGTVHDLGRSISHKVVICRKKYLEAKEPSQIARETYHTVESVDRYSLAFERVRFCHQRGMAPTEIAFSTQMSISLVKEYLNLSKEIEEKMRI